MKIYDAKTVGLFGTCGKSKWREPFIKRLNELGITWYNPCRVNLDPVEDLYQSKNDKIILIPVVNEIYGSGTLTASSYDILKTLLSVNLKTSKIVIYVSPELMYDASTTDLCYDVVRESKQAIRVVTDHINAYFRDLPNVYFVDSLEKMLEVTEYLVELTNLEEKIKELTKGENV